MSAPARTRTTEEPPVTATLPEAPAAVPAAGTGGTAPLVRRRRGAAVTRWAAPLAVFAALIGVWYAITYLVLDPARRFLMPPPQDVLAAFADGPTVERIGEALAQTVKVNFTGLGSASSSGWAGRGC